MTKHEMLEHLTTLGVKKSFKPYSESETGACMLETRKPAQISDGLVRGSEICLQGKLFRVWTPRKRLAHTLAKQHNLRVRLLDGEAELYVPPELADELLPKFGAKINHTRNLSAKTRLARSAGMHYLNKKHSKAGTSGVLNCAGMVR